MRCDDVAARLTDFLEGDLTPEVEAAALEHLATCPHSEQVLAGTRSVTQLARDHGRDVLGDDERASLRRRVLHDI